MATNIPRLGAKVKGSKTGQPIMVLFDLLSRSWAMGILWQLKGQPLNFRALQFACDNASPTTLNTRLKELRSVNLVIHSSKGYELTEQGQILIKNLLPLGAFAKEWTKSY